MCGMNDKTSADNLQGDIEATQNSLELIFIILDSFLGLSQISLISFKSACVKASAASWMASLFKVVVRSVFFRGKNPVHIFYFIHIVFIRIQYILYNKNTDQVNNNISFTDFTDKSLNKDQVASLTRVHLLFYG